MRHSFTSEADGRAAGPGHRPPLLVRPARSRRRALQPRSHPGRLPHLQRGGHGPLPDRPAQRRQLRRCGSPLAVRNRRAAPAGRADAEADTSYGMGWFVGPVNGIPAVFHQGETFNFHANIVLVPGSGPGSRGADERGELPGSLPPRIAWERSPRASPASSWDEEPPPPPSSTGIFVVYAALFGVIVLQVGGMIRSIVACGVGVSQPAGSDRKSRTGLALALNLAWASFVLVLVPKQLGLPLLTLAQGLPGPRLRAAGQRRGRLGWGIVRTAWAYAVLRGAQRREGTAHVALAHGRASLLTRKEPPRRNLIGATRRTRLRDKSCGPSSPQDWPSWKTSSWPYADKKALELPRHSTGASWRSPKQPLCRYFHAPGRIRTSDPRIRSPPLCPLSYGRVPGGYWPSRASSSAEASSCSAMKRKTQ